MGSSSPASVNEPRPLRGVALMVAASACYAAMGAAVKAAGAAMPAMVVVLGRSAVIVVAAIVLARVRRAPWIATNQRTMFWRSATGFVAMALYYWAITMVPLANAVTLQFTSPLFVALFSLWMLGERATLSTVLCILVAMVGAVLIVSPDLSAFDPHALAALASAVLAGLAYIYVRQLRLTDAPETIVLNFAIFSLVASLPFAPQLDALPAAIDLLTLAAVGVFAFGGQILMTYAYRYAEASFVSAFTYATVIFSALLGFAFFGEVPGAQALLGSALIVVAGVALSLASSVRKAR